MLILKRLYPEENEFKPVDFKLGLNLICGEKSKNKEGAVTSQRQNGVGKSLVVELVDYCLLNKNGDDKIKKIPEKYLPKDSFVNLHFEFNSTNYIISRNKKDIVKIKENDGKFITFKFNDARKHLNNILGLNNLISARSYLNFVIKHENYSYDNFIELFKSNFIDLLKVHFYFFSLPIDVVAKIKELIDGYKSATDNITSINKTLASKNLDIKKLKAVQNEIKTDVDQMENDFTYDKAVEIIDKSNFDIGKKEAELNELILNKNQLELELHDISSFSTMSDADFYVDDADIKLIFNKYKKGLGDAISKDIDQLKEFRNQVIKFKTELLTEKKSQLDEAIKSLVARITHLRNQIQEYNNHIILDKSNNLVKSFRIYKEKYNEFEENSRYINNYEEQSETKKDAKTNFAQLFKLLDESVKSNLSIINSFRDTFTHVHKSIMGTSECNFEIITANIFKVKSFFKIIVYIEGQGSKGINQMQSVIYDIALLANEFTSKLNLGLVIHDNLIFGSVDKITSIKTLNYLNTLNPSTFQYIATVNKDDYDYSVLHKEFNFDVKTSEVIQLTKEDPLFYEQFNNK